MTLKKQICAAVMLGSVSYMANAGGPLDSLDIKSRMLYSDPGSSARAEATHLMRKPGSLGLIVGTSPYTSNILMSKVGTTSSGISYYLNSFGNNAEGEGGMPGKELKVSGVVRLMSYYRAMQKYYDDMTTSPRNLSFTDYPISNIGSSNFGGYPNLELNLGSSLSKRFNFNVGYSMSHAFTGDPDAARTLSSLQNLTFTGNWSSGLVRSSLSAGGVMWPSLSRFTMGQPFYRENYFYRLPWDWHRRSFERYTEYYDLSQNMDIPTFGRSPFKGVILNTEVLPWATQFTALYGRTNRNVIFSNQATGFPSQTYALRVSKNVFERWIEGDVGLTYYKKDADTDRISDIADDAEIYSLDWNVKHRGYRSVTDIGLGRIVNPSSTGDWGLAFSTKLEFTRKLSPYPVSVEYYNIDHDIASIDGSIINSNASYEDGGVLNEFIYDNMLLINLNPEVGMISNNRHGINLKAEATFGDLKVELGYAMSQERENIYDTITFQHRANAFSRSRFTPWFQASGPYKRIKSYWLTTFETVTVTDEANGIATDYKKGFNQLELLLKYKTNLLAKQLVVLLFNNYGSIQDGFSIAPEMSDNAFIRTMYQDLTVAYKLGRNYNIVLNGSWESNKGNNRTQLSDENGKPIDQTGWSFAMGIDYDLTKTANVHLRHKWYAHEDKNFVLDEFQGTETVFEFKLFF